ncbi:hypothetical protein JCM21900_003981 [Sporobolomyces salmonicolor]
MNSRKAAKTIPATLTRFLKSNALLKSPPPAYYPLAAHPPPPSLVRSFPTRPDHDLPRRARSEENQDVYQVAKHKREQGIRLTAREDAALLNPVSSSAAGASATRRKPPRKANTKHSRPWEIVFPEDRIRRQFFRDHPFEAYRPVSLVEGEKVAAVEGPQGADWTELRQRSLVPTAEDCISFISNLVDAHHLPLSSAYPLGIAQFRTLRSEHETATLSARLEAQSFGAIFFGEIERGVLVEEKVLDQWVRAREIQDAFAISGGQGAVRQPAATAQALGMWAPEESSPAHLGGNGVVEADTKFTGGIEYIEAFARTREATQGAVRQEDGKLVGVEA